MSAPLDPQQAALQRALGTSYEIGRLLGRGGMGAVYLARELALERTVAIKVLPPEMASGADGRERFRREARTAAKLTHPNIVPLHTFGDVDGMLYFVMGYVRGESLGDRIARDDRMGAEDVRRIIGELADALDYAHRQGVVHRDIKPDNVLLDGETGRPMLTDFGVAKARATGATLTEAGAVVGTPYYMSPEQASGARDLDGRSDLYALGVMAYQMLAGRLPFEGETFRDVIVQHVSREAPPLAALAPDVPADVTQAVTRCLAKRPEDRWADGRSLRNALEQGGDDDADQLQPTANLRGTVPLMAVLLGADAAFAWAMYTIPSLRPDDGSPWWAPAALIAAVLTLFPALTGAVIHSRGASWLAIRKAMLEPPRWWPYWYPRRWRAAGDVWDRLPVLVRRWRATVLTAWGFMGVGMTMLAMAIYRMNRDPLDPFGKLLGMYAYIPALVGVGLQMWPAIRAQKWGKALGLNTLEVQRFAFGSTAKRDFWRKPKFAALLLAADVASENARRSEPRAPADFAGAIAEAASRLDGPMRAAADEAIAAAKHVVGAIAALDAEVAVLARDASPGEIAAVEQKLASLGDAANEPASRGELRQMLTNQRDLLRRLSDQLAEATRRRERLLDLLRTLWLQVANLRAEAAREALDGADVTGRIRAVAAEIRNFTDAASSLRLPGET